MIRKITLLFLLCFGLHTIGHTQIRDSVKIYLPLFQDTTCPGSQLTFTAVQSNDTFSHVSYKWYTNSFYTGVKIDTFKTTALSDGDSVFCWILFTNSLGFKDSFKSNTIYIYRRPSIKPGVLISLIKGSNPDCAGYSLTFKAFPKNGGIAPMYQWRVNGVDVPGADTATFSGIFGGSDTISCLMIGNSPCSAPFNDTVLSNVVPIIHTHLHASISIVDKYNPICGGTIDTFKATISDPGTGAYTAWYVNSKLISAAVGNVYITDSLHNGDLVYAILNTPDTCEVSDSVVSNIITMTVIPNSVTAVSTLMIHGANPGCIDSPLTFVGTYSGFGTAPTYDWQVNGVTVASGITTYTSTFLKKQILTFRVNNTDGGCYTHDTLSSPGVFMLRDSTPAAPLLSLISNLLVNNMAGKYRWYFSPYNAYVGSLIGGASDQTYHPHSALGGAGYYYTILDTANCPSDPSNIIYIALLKVKSLNTSDVRVYPNPTSGIVNLDWSGRVVNAQVDVYSVVGQAMLHEEIISQSAHEVNMGNLPEGNYIIALRDNDDGSVATYKVFLKK